LGGKFSGDMPKLFTQAEADFFLCGGVLVLHMMKEMSGREKGVLMVGIILGFGNGK
jgi:hypothetical protein